MANTMPLRNSKEAPSFSTDHPIEIDIFLYDFEQLSKAKGLTDKEKIENVTVYTDQRARDLWTCLDTYQGDSWEAFKKEVLEQYIADPDNRYSIRDLENVVGHAKEFRSTAEYLEYHRDFTVISQEMVKKEQITKIDAEKLYLSGIKGGFREEVLQRLMITHPTIYRGGPYPIATVRAAVLFLLKGSLQASSATTLVSTSVASSTASVTPKAEESSLESTVMELKQGFESIRAMLTRQGAGSYRDNQFSNGQQAQSNICNYCRESGHYRRNCAAYAQDLRDNLIRINPDNNRISMADGSEILGPPTLSLKDKVRNQSRGTLNRDTPPHMSNGSTAPVLMLRADAYEQPEPGKALVRASTAYIEELKDDQPQDEQRAVEISEAESYVARVVEDKRKADDELKKAEMRLTELRSGKKVRFSGVEVPTLASAAQGFRNETVDPGTAASRPTLRQPEKAPTGGPTTTTAHTTAVTIANKSTRTDDLKPNTSKVGGDKSYRFKSPIEAQNSDASNWILKALLSTQISVSAADLLSACPKVRQDLKEQCSGKRVPRTDSGESKANAVFMQHGPQYVPTSTPKFGVSSTGGVAAMDRFALRTIKVHLDNVGPLQAILDSGSSFIAIPRRVSNALQRPYRSDKLVRMTTADGNNHWTLGLVPEAILTVGPVKLSVPLQIVDNGDFDVLLGRPFFALTRCITRDTQDGSQTITIKDPDTHDEYTIPTAVLSDKENLFDLQDF